MALGGDNKLDESLATSKKALDLLKAMPAGNLNAEHFRGRVLVEEAKVRSKLPNRSENILREAEAETSQAVAVWDGLLRRSPTFSPYREWQAMGYEVRGRIRTALGLTDLAADDLEKSAKILDRLISQSPDMPGYRALIGQTYLTFGRLEGERKHAEKAKDYYTKARDALEASLKKAPEDVLDQRTLAEAKAALKGAD
jgi:tetratricopeptide (TPR) repeat protein